MIYAASVLTFLAWFYMIFTGRNPFFEFTSKAVRAYERANGYLYLLTSRYPRISLEEDPEYVMASELEQGQLGRAKVLFRIILMIPVLIVSWILGYGLALIGFVSWIIVLIRGKLPTSLHEALVAIIRFQGRVLAYVFLLQDPYPRGLFGDKSTVVDADVAPFAERTDIEAMSSPLGIDQATGGAPTSADHSSAVDAALHDDSDHGDSVEGSDMTNSQSWALTLSAGARRILVAALVIGVVAGGLYTAFVPRWRFRPNIETNISASAWNSQYRSDVVGLRHAMSSYHTTLNSMHPNWSTLLNDCQNLQNDYKVFDTVPFYPGSADVRLVTGLGAIYTGLNDCVTVIAPFKVSKAMPVLAKQLQTGSTDLNDFLQQTDSFQSGQAT